MERAATTMLVVLAAALCLEVAYHYATVGSLGGGDGGYPSPQAFAREAGLAPRPQPRSPAPAAPIVAVALAASLPAPATAKAPVRISRPLPAPPSPPESDQVRSGPAPDRLASASDRGDAGQPTEAPPPVAADAQTPPY